MRRRHSLAVTLSNSIGGRGLASGDAMVSTRPLAPLPSGRNAPPSRQPPARRSSLFAKLTRRRNRSKSIGSGTHAQSNGLAAANILEKPQVDTSAQPPIKSVRFNRKVSQRKVPSCLSMNEAHKSEIWYTADERLQMSRDAVRAARDAPQPLHMCLQQAYRNARYLANVTSDDAHMHEMLKDSSNVRRQSQCLSEWAEGFACSVNQTVEIDAYRGLEDMASPLHRYERGMDSFDSRMAVIENCPKHRRSSLRSSDMDDTHLALHYQELARPCVYLARLFAAADAAAVNMDILCCS